MSKTISCSGFVFDIRKENTEIYVRYRPGSRFDNDSPIDGQIPYAVLEKGDVDGFCRAIERLVPGVAERLDRQVVTKKLQAWGWLPCGVTSPHDQIKILEEGKRIYLSPRDRYTGPNNRKYADGPAYSAAKYILAEERFITNHDDTAMFIELIDEDEKVIKSWKFDCPMKKWFSDPDYYEDDCLVFYMTERLHLPTVGYRWPK
jgi:hypothetical protein